MQQLLWCARGDYAIAIARTIEGNELLHQVTYFLAEAIASSTWVASQANAMLLLIPGSRLAIAFP